MTAIIVFLGVLAFVILLMGIAGTFYLGAYVALRARDSLPFGGIHWKRISRMTPEREAEIETGKQQTTQRPRNPLKT